MTQDQEAYIPYLKDSLTLYCEWLNKWIDDDQPQYSPDQFLVYDPNNGLYGNSMCNGTLYGYYALYHFTISDGEEGGSHELIVWFDADGKIIHMTQVFDTYVTSIFDHEKGMFHVPNS